MDMIERVARAVVEHLGVSLAFEAPHSSDTPTIQFCKKMDTEQAVTIARAAIEAMMEPTEEMMAAGEHKHEYDAKNLVSVRWMLDECYKAMIAEALK